MIAYHATPTRNVALIMREGLRPDAPGKGSTNLPGVYFLSDPGSCAGFVSMLYREPVTTLAVDLSGIDTGHGDDDDDIVVSGVVAPDRIKVHRG